MKFEWSKLCCAELLERCLERRKQRRMVLHELLVARKKRKSASNGKTTEGLHGNAGTCCLKFELCSVSAPASAYV